MSDTVVIETKETIADLDAIENELTASFTLNNFIAVKIIQPDKTTLFQLKDISIPYMDLVFPADSMMKADTKTLVKSDTLTSAPTTEFLTNKQPENEIPIWLIISITLNLVLTVLLVRKKK
ncbi:MAG TPA: hypothetical protein VIM65_03260 [Cyclobacteriaceae bacterium]